MVIFFASRLSYINRLEVIPVEKRGRINLESVLLAGACEDGSLRQGAFITGEGEEGGLHRTRKVI